MRGMGIAPRRRRPQGLCDLGVAVAPLKSMSESLDSQEDSRHPVCTFPHVFFLSTRCGTRRGCFGALLWEGRAGILVLRVGDVSERIDCGSRCLCRSSVAMSRAGKWRLNRRSLFRKQDPGRDSPRLVGGKSTK